MVKPSKLNRGDTVAIVSLSSGAGGEPVFRHRYEIGKKRLESEFGLNVVAMPNTLKGAEYLDKHPEARAADLMGAFEDSGIKAVISMIGGDDTIRLLRYVNLETIRKNPKIFMGYSDTTINHFMMYKAGLVSFYGPCVIAEFAENVAMHEYTTHYIDNILFNPSTVLRIEPSSYWTSEFLDWTDERNNNIARKMIKDSKGFELLQGNGTVRGKLLGGCLDVLPMLIGTELWPAPEEWNGSILFLETSEECPPPQTVKYFLRGFAAQGIFGRVGGIVFGKPLGEKYYEEYKREILRVTKECGSADLPVLYNMNFGHSAPMCILPYGITAEINCAENSFRLLEQAVI